MLTSQKEVVKAKSFPPTRSGIVSLMCGTVGHSATSSHSGALVDGSFAIFRTWLISALSILLYNIIVFSQWEGEEEQRFIFKKSRLSKWARGWTQNYCSHIESLLRWPPCCREGWKIQPLIGHSGPGCRSFTMGKKWVWGQHWSLPQWGCARFPDITTPWSRIWQIIAHRPSSTHRCLYKESVIGTQPYLFIYLTSMANFTLQWQELK